MVWAYKPLANYCCTTRQTDGPRHKRARTHTHTPVCLKNVSYRDARRLMVEPADRAQWAGVRAFWKWNKQKNVRTCAIRHVVGIDGNGRAHTFFSICFLVAFSSLPLSLPCLRAMCCDVHHPIEKIGLCATVRSRRANVCELPSFHSSIHSLHSHEWAPDGGEHEKKWTRKKTRCRLFSVYKSLLLYSRHHTLIPSYVLNKFELI